MRRSPTRLAAVTPDMVERKSAFAARAQLQRDAAQSAGLPDDDDRLVPADRGGAQGARRPRQGRAERRRLRRRSCSRRPRAPSRWQEEIGLDVLVHGEFERNDMVQYFGEQLAGFAFTKHGWVQIYGSRCVRPPILFGDVSRPKPMTVGWWRYAQSLTPKPMKGMLTGPVTILNWSFVRDDLPRSVACRQIALAIRDEVADLEAAGVAMIQIDEAALREGLPLRTGEWERLSRMGGGRASGCAQPACATRRRSTPTCATRSSTTSSRRSARWMPT